MKNIKKIDLFIVIIWIISLLAGLIISTNTASQGTSTIYILEFIHILIFSVLITGLIILRPKDFMHNSPFIGFVIFSALFIILSFFDLSVKNSDVYIEILFISCIIPLYTLCVEKLSSKKTGTLIASLMSLIVLIVSYMIKFEFSLILYMYLTFYYAIIPIFIRTYNNKAWYISIIPFVILITLTLSLIYTYDVAALKIIFRYMEPSTNTHLAESLPILLIMALQLVSCFLMLCRSFNLKSGKNRLMALSATLFITMQLTCNISTVTSCVSVSVYCLVPVLLFFNSLYQDKKVVKSDKNYLTWFDKLILAKDYETPEAKKHYMNLTEENFCKFKTGKKIVELRLLDKKRKEIEKGDMIVFTNVETGESLEGVCSCLFYANNFVELFEQTEKEDCGFAEQMSLMEISQYMRRFYSEEQEKEFGVVGIKVKCF